MKVGILVLLVVLPMLASIGFYSYAFLSTRWSSIDNDLIFQYQTKLKQRDDLPNNYNHTIQFETRTLRQQFRTRYGLFGYCLDYQWLTLLTIKSAHQFKANSTSGPCDNPSTILCQELNLCVKKCDNIVDCPSHIDENECIRNYDQTDYYWTEGKCLWHSLLSDIQGIPRWLSSYFRISTDSYQMKLIRYYLMLIFFFAALILTIFALLVLFCMNCINRFYSIPFAFVGCFTLAAFVSGTSALGIFLYEWINERLYQLDYTQQFGQLEQSIVALNPWIINVERLGLAFWFIVAAIALNLFTTILSCCLCCGLQSEKSKLRIHVNNDKYAIVHTNLYDE